MRLGALILYLLLLLVPALVVGGVAITLLGREQQRIGQAVAEAQSRRAETIADELALAVIEAERRLIEQLRAFPADGLEDALADWERQNPLVRNVFVWEPPNRLLLPNPSSPATDEQRRFVQRYESLFSGGSTWGEGQVDPSESALTTSSGRSPSPRRQLSDMIVRSVKSAAVKGNDSRAPSSRWHGGWVPWFSENSLCLLGWVADPESGQKRGVEMEMAALLAQLLPALPGGMPPGEACALLDGRGRVLHQTGELMIESGAAPVGSARVGPALPHWEVAIHADPSGTAVARHALLLVSALLVGIFVLAMLTGGVLLFWNARRSELDARRKTTFVSNVSHELKTPLTSIRMYAELLFEGRVSDQAKRERYLNVIVAESRRLTRLVNNVLDFSRLEQGRKQYRRDTLDLGETVSAALEGQRMRVEEAGMTVVSEPPAEPVPVIADRDALEQVLINLIDNAVKYAAEGGELGVVVEQATGGGRVRVLDRGPGIPRRHLVRVFDTFFRIDGSLTAKQPGTGLGLSLSRRMARDMGGDLTAEAREGGGACLTFTLPGTDKA